MYSKEELLKMKGALFADPSVPRITQMYRISFAQITI